MFDLFGEVDINPRTQRPASAFPSWYFTEQISELKEQIRHNSIVIDNGWIPATRLPQARVDLENMEKRLAQIKDSIPKVTEMELDAYAKLHREITDLLNPTYFTRSDMQKGIADAHEEARRMTESCIDVRGDVHTLCRACACKIEDGKVSREELARVWKIIGKFLGLNTNTEILRRD